MRWALVVMLAACGGAYETTMLPLCSVCTSDGDCESGICKMYGDGYRKCSTTCDPYESAPQCISPAVGYCNGMGYCGCQFMHPVDAGVPDDGYRDAGEAPLDAATADAS